MSTDAPKAQRKETSKRAAAAKKTLPKVSEITDDIDGIDISDDDFEAEIVAAEKKKGGRKPANSKAAAKPPTAAAKKRGAAAAKQQSQLTGQKLITEVLKPSSSSSENPEGISPEKKVRKMRESPFNKKSGSVLGSSSVSGGDSVSDSTEEVSKFVLPRTSRPQRGNRTKAVYVVSDSEEDDDGSDDPEELIESDFEDED